MRLVPLRLWIKDRPNKTGGAESLAALGRRLHAMAAAAARRPRLYAELGVRDDPQGRFEALTVCVILLLDRVGPRTAAGQALFDTYIADLDGALREMGLGDLAMAKRMKALGRGFYGRAAAWREALARLPDQATLLDLIGRTLAPDSGATQRTELARDLLSLREALARGDPLDPGVAMP